VPAPDHDCPGCGAPGVPYGRLSCTPCWFRLPVPIRGRITRAWRSLTRWPHDSDLLAAHRKAVADAGEWYRDNPAVGRG
jgi:hypothetical protein